MLNVIMLFAIMLNSIMLNAIMLNVMAPQNMLLFLVTKLSQFKLKVKKAFVNSLFLQPL
jgi:hypothetical protein